LRISSRWTFPSGRRTSVWSSVSDGERVPPRSATAKQETAANDNTSAQRRDQGFTGEPAVVIARSLGVAPAVFAAGGVSGPNRNKPAARPPALHETRVH
jgi:hypothetical protein